MGDLYKIRNRSSVNFVPLIEASCESVPTTASTAQGKELLWRGRRKIDEAFIVKAMIHDCVCKGSTFKFTGHIILQ